MAGQRLRVLFERRYKPGGVAFCCEGGLAFCCEGGPAGSVMLPVAWTDRGEPAADRALGYEQLVELAALVGVFATRRGD